MAKKFEIPDIPESDRLGEFSHPRETTDLIGHRDPEQALLDGLRSDKLHHAWLISGPRGVGKATLAYRFARFLLCHGGEIPAGADTLQVDPEDPVFHRVAAQSHSDLVALRRPYDEKTKKFKRDIPVDEVRRLNPFFGKKAGEGGWRIAIVDSADDLNNNAANALLKILEEPPERAILLLLSHAPHRLLPTIRSRCRSLSLKPVPPQEVCDVLERRGTTGDIPPLSLEDRSAIAYLCGGSIGRALAYAGEGGLDLYKDFIHVLSTLSHGDYEQVRSFCTQFSGQKGEPKWVMFGEILEFWFNRVVIHAVSGLPLQEIVPGEGAAFEYFSAVPQMWVDQWEQSGHLFERTNAVNLDRVQVSISMFLEYKETIKRAA